MQPYENAERNSARRQDEHLNADSARSAQGDSVGKRRRTNTRGWRFESQSAWRSRATCAIAMNRSEMTH